MEKERYLITIRNAVDEVPRPALYRILSETERAFNVHRLEPADLSRESIRIHKKVTFYYVVKDRDQAIAFYRKFDPIVDLIEQDLAEMKVRYEVERRRFLNAQKKKVVKRILEEFENSGVPDRARGSLRC